MPCFDENLPWGHLPAEQYLVQHWERDSDEENVEQYRRLIRAFLQSGTILETEETQQPLTISCTPTEDEINSILRPWRPQKLRKIAIAMKVLQDDEVVLLRTHYSGQHEDNETLRYVVAEDESYDPNYKREHLWWRILDDKDHFSVGDFWESVLMTLPELTARGRGMKSYLSLERLQEILQEEDWYEAEVHDWVCLGIPPIAIMDKESFTSTCLKFLFLDLNGNIVRSMRQPPSYIGTWRMSNFRANVVTSYEWEEAEVGEQYRADGAIGRMLQERIEAIQCKQKADKEWYLIEELDLC